MNVLDFISHIKHNSLSIEIKTIEGREFKTLYTGDVGGYKNSVAKEKLNKRRITVIVPEDCLLQILLED